MAIEDWMEEARQSAAQCWCDKETSGTSMDHVLAEAVAKRIAAWMDTSAQESRNTNFYRTLIRLTGDVIGPKSRVADDGSIQDDVIALKVPSLVEKLKEELQKADERITVLSARLERYEEPEK